MLISLDFFNAAAEDDSYISIGKNSGLIFYLEARACISHRVFLSSTGTFLLCKYTSRQKCLIENPYGNKCTEDQTLCIHFTDIPCLSNLVLKYDFYFLLNYNMHTI